MVNATRVHCRVMCAGLASHNPRLHIKVPSAMRHPAVPLCLQRMTRLVGVETYLLEPQLLAAALQRRFAAAAGANPLPGAKAGGACEVVVQGDVAAKV